MVASGAFLSASDMARRASPTLALPWDLDAIAGVGESAIVWSAHEHTSKRAVALKIAKRPDALVHEAELLARIDRRWGPALLAAGRMPEGVRDVVAGAPYVVTDWVEGEALAPLRVKDRERTAAIVAHGVARAIA
jgi:hypothetical protein